MNFYNPYQTQQFGFHPQMQAMPQYQPPQPQPPQQQTSGVIWVQGEAGAKSYMVAAGNTVLMLDADQPVMYLKSCDMSGIPSLRIFDFTERTGAQSGSMRTDGEYVTRKEFNELLQRLKVKHKKKDDDEEEVGEDG